MYSRCVKYTSDDVLIKVHFSMRFRPPGNPIDARIHFSRSGSMIQVAFTLVCFLDFFFGFFLQKNKRRPVHVMFWNLIKFKKNKIKVLASAG